MSVTLQNPQLFLYPAMNEILASSKHGKLMIQSWLFSISKCLKNMVKLLGK